MGTSQTTADSIKSYYGAGNITPPMFPVIFLKKVFRRIASKLND